MLRFAASAIASSYDVVQSLFYAQAPKENAAEALEKAKRGWQEHWKSKNNRQTLVNSQTERGTRGLYTALPSSRHTRVIQATCLSDQPSKRFRFELMPVNIDNPEVPYIAISYTWGNAVAFTKVDCGNGNPQTGSVGLHVTENFSTPRILTWHTTFIS